MVSLSRGYPQAWRQGEVVPQALQMSGFGVDLMVPVDTYQKVLCSVKYGILFVLLLSVSEHPGFGPTYLLAALQSEDYALLIGSLGLFVILAGVMILTRKVDWYRPGVRGR